MKSPYFMLGAVALVSLVGCNKPATQAKGEKAVPAVQPSKEKGEPTVQEERQDKRKNDKVTREEALQISQKVLEDYLTNKPELFVAAIEKAMQKQQEERIRKIEEGASKAQATFWKSKLIAGNKDAKLKMVFFFDPLDPFSQKVYKESLKPLVKDRSDVGVFMIPVSVFSGQDSDHPSSLVPTTAMILAVAQDPKKALAFWDKFPGPQEEFSKTKMLKAAKDAGLDEKKLAKDLEDQASLDAVIENGKLATDLRLPPQMPIMMVRFPDSHMEFIPPLAKDRMEVACDAILKGQSWVEAVSALEERADDTDKKASGR